MGADCQVGRERFYELYAATAARKRLIAASLTSISSASQPENGFGGFEEFPPEFLHRPCCNHAPLKTIPQARARRRSARSMRTGLVVVPTLLCYLKPRASVCRFVRSVVIAEQIERHRRMNAPKVIIVLRVNAIMLPEPHAITQLDMSLECVSQRRESHA